MLTLGSTKKCCVAQKTKKIFHIEVNVAHQNYVSLKKIYSGNKKLCDTQKKTHVSVAQKMNTYLQKLVPVVYKYMLY